MGALCDLKYQEGGFLYPPGVNLPLRGEPVLQKTKAIPHYTVLCVGGEAGTLTVISTCCLSRCAPFIGILLSFLFTILMSLTWRFNVALWRILQQFLSSANSSPGPRFWWPKNITNYMKKLNLNRDSNFSLENLICNFYKALNLNYKVRFHLIIIYLNLKILWKWSIKWLKISIKMA